MFLLSRPLPSTEHTNHPNHHDTFYGVHLLSSILAVQIEWPQHSNQSYHAASKNLKGNPDPDRPASITLWGS